MTDIAGETFTITGRRRFDPMSVSRVGDFRLRAVEAEDPSLSWTPYCLDAATQRAALAGCAKDADLAAAPFYYQAQYRHASQLKLVDAAALQQLADSHATPAPHPVMIYSTGRAGTTLVSKMFARLSHCVSLSEPDFHTSLLEVGRPKAAGHYALSAWEVPDWLADPAPELLRAAARLYFQPQSAAASHLVLKFRGMGVELAATLRQAHPGVVEFFLYRDAEAYVESSMRAFSYFRSPLWTIRWVHWLKLTRPLIKKGLDHNFDVMQRFFPLCARYTTVKLAELGPIGLLTLSWLSMMETARALQLPALRYENLLRDPRHALEQLLVRCGLPTSDLPLALAALDEDSQRGSVVAKEKTSRYKLSPRDRELIRRVLASQHTVRFASRGSNSTMLSRNDSIFGGITQTFRGRSTIQNPTAAFVQIAQVAWAVAGARPATGWPCWSRTLLGTMRRAKDGSLRKVQGCPVCPFVDGDGSRLR